MARYHGSVGYATSVEDPPGSGVYIDHVVEHAHYGDVIRASHTLSSEQHLAQDVTLGNRLSVVTNAFAMENFHLIRYAELNGRRWAVTSVELQRPRLILSLGGLYNGPTA